MHAGLVRVARSKFVRSFNFDGFCCTLRARQRRSNCFLDPNRSPEKRHGSRVERPNRNEDWTRDRIGSTKPLTAFAFQMDAAIIVVQADTSVLEKAIPEIVAFGRRTMREQSVTSAAFIAFRAQQLTPAAE